MMVFLKGLRISYPVFSLCTQILPQKKNHGVSGSVVHSELIPGVNASVNDLDLVRGELNRENLSCLVSLDIDQSGCDILLSSSAASG